MSQYKFFLFEKLYKEMLFLRIKTKKSALAGDAAMLLSFLDDIKTKGKTSLNKSPVGVKQVCLPIPYLPQ